MSPSVAPLDDFRAAVRDWCQTHVPAGWRQAQTGASADEYVAFQQSWFQELRRAGLLELHKHIVSLPDLPRLKELGEFDDLYLHQSEIA